MSSLPVLWRSSCGLDARRRLRAVALIAGHGDPPHSGRARSDIAEVTSRATAPNRSIASSSGCTELSPKRSRANSVRSLSLFDNSAKKIAQQCSVSAVWGMMVLLGLSVAPDPVRIATTAVLVSRPRPMSNLLAYWIGGMAAGLAFCIASLTLLRDFLPGFVHSITSMFATLTGGHTKIVFGVLLLTLAALCAKGLVRQRAQVPVSIPGPPAVAPRRILPGPISRPLAWFRHSLKDGRPWISFVVGLNQGPPLVELFAAISIIEASGASIGAQLGATVVFIATVFAIIEIPLLSYLVRPAQTEIFMLSMCKWLGSHRRQFITVAAGTAGIILLVSGMGIM